MLPQQARLCLQALHVSINEFSTFVAARGPDDDVVASITAEGGPRLRDTLTQLLQLCEIVEELANVLQEMCSPTQTAESCSTVTLHQPLDMSQTTQEGRKLYQDSPFKPLPVGLEHDKSLENIPVSSFTRDLLCRGVHPFPFPRDPNPPPIGPVYLRDILAAEPDADLVAAPPKSDIFKGTSVSCIEPLDQFAHCKILIAEDNMINQRIMQKILGKLGLHNKVVAPDGQAAVDSVRESMDIYHQPFDFIFMDETMPLLSGHEATRLIRDMGFGGPICAMLVNATLANKQKTLDAGVTTIIQKPFLVRAVRSVLEQYLTPLVEEPDIMPPMADESPLPRRKPDIKSKL